MFIRTFKKVQISINLSYNILLIMASYCIKFMYEYFCGCVYGELKFMYEALLRLCLSYLKINLKIRSFKGNQFIVPNLALIRRRG